MIWLKHVFKELSQWIFIEPVEVAQSLHSPNTSLILSEVLEDVKKYEM